MMVTQLHFDLDRIHNLLSHLEEGIVLCDAADNILYVNFAATLALHFNDTELIGKPFRRFCSLTADNGSSGNDAAPTHKARIGKGIVTRKNGEEQEIHIRIVPIDNDAQINAYILAPVGMLNSSLANDREKLKVIQASRMRALGELATGMAHELSQPLSIIALNAGLIQRRLRAEEDDYIAEKLGQIVQQVQRASDVILHLRQFTKGSQNSLEQVDLNEAVKSSLVLLRHRLNRANITIDLKLGNRNPKIEGKFTDMEQIILQCVLNAYEALESDVKKEKRITIKTELLETELRLSIEDNGGGMPDFILQHIFTPFFSSKRNGEGMGLGLAVCQLLADEMNARMTVSTSLGVGTAVRVHIPLTQCVNEIH